ncbi:MAG: RNB domain-containing ribonuclease [Burkholderiales bacterium]|nr:RNB domain-containing ribonuclease [Burkholderiales bacterium]
MNVFYEEDGGFRIGAVLADAGASLQVEAVHGKRSKVKAAHVLFRFEGPIAGFVEDAQRAAQDIDVDFLWECCGQDEFGFETLARDYYGHAPAALEQAAVLYRLHGSPMYFYRRGKGRYRPAPAEALKAALASVERKRQQALQQARYIEELSAFRLPAEFQPILPQLLYRPDRNTIEAKALEQAASEAGLSVAELLSRCGAIASSRDYHVNRFLFDYFPDGAQARELPESALPDDLPVAPARAFSIDDSTTTEIDDAFSVRPLSGGGWEIGVHIAAPALGIPPGSILDQEAGTRLSTVYMPGGKITMLPASTVERFTLAEGRTVPAVSLYMDVAADLRIRGTRSAVERVEIVGNLRHGTLEAQFNEDSLDALRQDFPFGPELKILYDLATVLEGGRGRPEQPRPVHMDYSFYVENDRVRIVRRKRGAPMDKLVSELMIYVNSEWGRQLAEAGVAAIYRAQGNGKVRMSTIPAAHQGLGVAYYTWISSPLRRYVDLLNQQQLVSWLRGDTPAYGPKSERLLTAMRDFDQAYEAYNEFQRMMERYWCLRWLEQEQVTSTYAEVIRENVAKIGDMPLVGKIHGLPFAAPGSIVEVDISDIDLLGIDFRAQYRAMRPLPAP